MRRFTQVLPALIIILVMTATALAAQSSRVAPLRANTPHGHVHRISEVRLVAKRSWRQAHGPTKAQVARYRHALRYPVHNTRGRMKLIWQRKREALAHVRAMKRLKARCGYSNVKPCILYAATKFGQSYSYALGVAYCESTLNPYASNGSHFGLFQFDGVTWAGSPYDDNGSVYNPFWNSMAAMWYWARGEFSRWSCA